MGSSSSTIQTKQTEEFVDSSDDSEQTSDPCDHDATATDEEEEEEEQETTNENKGTKKEKRNRRTKQRQQENPEEEQESSDSVDADADADASLYQSRVLCQIQLAVATLKLAAKFENYLLRGQDYSDYAVRIHAARQVLLNIASDVCGDSDDKTTRTSHP